MVINCHAQNKWVACSSSYLAGVADGCREQILYHPTQLFQEFPHLNRDWWDIRCSYRNKYSEPSYLVAFSDANHFFKASSLVLNCVSVGFSFGDIPKKGKGWWILKRIARAYICNKIGFATSYYLIFKNKVQ